MYIISKIKVEIIFLHVYIKNHSQCIIEQWILYGYTMHYHILPMNSCLKSTLPHILFEKL